MVKWRNKECARQVCGVVLDPMQAPPDAAFIQGQSLGYPPWKFANLEGVSGTVTDQRGTRTIAKRECGFSKQISARVARYSEMVNLAGFNGGDFEASPEGFAWKSRPMLYSSEAFFFDGRNQLAVAQ